MGIGGSHQLIFEAVGNGEDHVGVVDGRRQIGGVLARIETVLDGAGFYAVLGLDGSHAGLT